MLKIVVIMSLLTSITDRNAERNIEYHEEIFNFVQPDVHTDLDWKKLQEEFVRYEAIKDKIVKEIAKRDLSES